MEVVVVVVPDATDMDPVVAMDIMDTDMYTMDTDMDPMDTDMDISLGTDTHMQGDVRGTGADAGTSVATSTISVTRRGRTVTG